MFLGWFFVLLLVRDHLTTASKKIIGAVGSSSPLPQRRRYSALLFIGDRFALLPLERDGLFLALLGSSPAYRSWACSGGLVPQRDFPRAGWRLRFSLPASPPFSCSLTSACSPEVSMAKFQQLRAEENPGLFDSCPKRRPGRIELAGVHFALRMRPAILDLLLITDKGYIFVNTTGDSSFSIPMETVRAMIYESVGSKTVTF